MIYIIEMAHSLKLNVCIEGVETEEELQEIKEDMKYQKKAAYQEIMLENYILQ